MLSIVASMERELPSLRQDPGLFRGTERGNGRGEELRVLGIGPDRSAAAMEELLSREQEGSQRQCRAVLLVGFAGGADPLLETGDLALATSYHWLPRGADARGTGPLEAFSPDPAMVRLAERAASNAGLKTHAGPSVTVDTMVHSPREKLLIYKAFSASTVNMEDFAAAQAAAKSGVPFLSARVVLDPQGQTLPGDLIELAAAGPVAAISAAAKPWQFPVLLSLYGRMRRAQGVLAKFTKAFVSEYRAWEEAQYTNADEGALVGSTYQQAGLQIHAQASTRAHTGGADRP